MKAQSPLLGFNNNVRHKGRVFHIQTEDSGIKHPHVITHLFADGGRIVRSQKTSYAEYVGDEEMQRKVRALMQEQHKAMFIALRAGKFDHLLDGIPAAEPTTGGGGHRPPMESTVSIEIGTPSDPGGIVHVAPGSPSTAGAVKTGLTPPPSPAVTASAPPKLAPASAHAATLPAVPKPLAPAAAAAAPQPPARARLTPPPPQKPPARPPSIIPPAAKALAPATAPTIPAPDPAAPRPPMRKTSGLLAALGALSSGNKAPSLGASPPLSQSGAPSSRQAPASAASPQGPPPQRPPSAPNQRPVVPNQLSTAHRPPATSNFDLDLEALERASEQGNSPVYRQVRDFPPPPQAVRASGVPALRSLTPRPSSASPPATSAATAGAAAGAGRYAPSRPASIFGNAKPQEGSSIFGEDLISEKSLDEVILSYLAEDLEPPPKK